MKQFTGIAIAFIGMMLAGAENEQPFAWWIEVGYHLGGVAMFIGGIALAGGLKGMKGNERME